MGVKLLGFDMIYCRFTTRKFVKSLLNMSGFAMKCWLQKFVKYTEVVSTVLTVLIEAVFKKKIFPFFYLNDVLFMFLNTSFKSFLWTSAYISSILRMRGFEINSQPKNNYKFEHNWKQPLQNMQYTMWAMKPKQAFNLRASFDTIKIYVDTKQWVNQQMYVYNGPCHIWFMKARDLQHWFHAGKR